MNNLRFEKKVVINHLDEKQVERIIKNYHFIREIHHKRQINNIYLDSLNKKSYLENLNGEGSREKIRIRWYDNLTGLIKKPKLEIKGRINEIGTKKVFFLNNFYLDNINLNELKNNIYTSNIDKKIINKIKNLRISVINSYNRKYFEDINKNYRLTIDTNLKFYKINKRNKLIKISHEKNNIILEIKYRIDKDDKVRQLIKNFVFRIDKSSKYVLGINKLRL